MKLGKADRMSKTKVMSTAKVKTIDYIIKLFKKNLQKLPQRESFKKTFKRTWILDVFRLSSVSREFHSVGVIITKARPPLSHKP